MLLGVAHVDRRFGKDVILVCVVFIIVKLARLTIIHKIAQVEIFVLERALLSAFLSGNGVHFGALPWALGN